MNTTSQVRGICVKVRELRKNGFSDLEQFLDDPKNILVCRRGRIWITDAQTREKRIFHWPDSPWANPYKVGDAQGCHSLQDSLALFSQYLDQLLRDDATMSKFLLLLDAERIGCFCEREEECHRGIILKKLRALESFASSNE